VNYCCFSSSEGTLNVNLLEEFTPLEHFCFCLGVAIHANVHAKMANTLTWLGSFKNFCSAIEIGQLGLGFVWGFGMDAGGAMGVILYMEI